MSAKHLGKRFVTPFLGRGLTASGFPGFEPFSRLTPFPGRRMPKRQLFSLGNFLDFDLACLYSIANHDLPDLTLSTT
jgi:hypothetical protein